MDGSTGSGHTTEPLGWERSGSPVGAGDLDALEAELGITLPPKYRSFLLAQNGGRPSRRWFSIPDHFDGEDEVGDMLAVGNPYEHCDLAASWRTYHEYASRGLLPIGWTSSSGMIGIDLSTPGEEPVIYMEWSDPDPPEVRRPYYLAQDIDAFCARLRSE